MTGVESPLVSVVIPAFNSASFVVDAANSALGQTLTTLEVIVVDDGSTDNTTQVLKGIGDERLRLIRQENQGVSRARNAGISAAKGEYVAFLDADDYWLPEKLQQQLAVMEADSKVIALGTFMRYESTSGRELGVSGVAISPDDQARIRSGHLMPFPISSTVVRNATLREIGGFDEVLGANVPGQVEDLDLMTRLAGRGEIRCVERVLGVYRLHSGSATSQRLASQRVGTRYVRARTAARSKGDELAWEDFIKRYKPTLRQRHGDLVQGLYRRWGLFQAEGRKLRGALYGIGAIVLNPIYTVRRLRQQRGRERSRTGTRRG